MDKILNGFNNGRDKSDGVGGDDPQIQMPINTTETDETEVLFNIFALAFYKHLRPTKLMTTNDIAKFVTDFLNENK